MARLACFLLVLTGLIRASAAPAAPLTENKVEELRARMRANFFVPDPLPAVAAKQHRRFVPASGVRAEAVTYATQLGMRVPAILYLPDPLPRGKIPAFIVVNGHGGDKYSWYAYYTGVMFARGGAAVLAYDQAGEGERSSTRGSGTREHDKLVGDEVMARRLGGLMITDVMQAVSYVRSRPEVDASRVAAAGYSLGSFVLSLAAAIEPRLHACVLVGGGNLDHPGGYWDGSKQMCQGLPYKSLAFLGDRAATVYALHAARGPTLIWNGRNDTVVGMPKTQDDFFADLRRRVIALRGTDQRVFEFGFVDGTSHRPYFVTKPVVSWLERQIDFPNWTIASIDALPETRIGDWAGRVGVPMDRLYATEDREGGAMGIGADVPGVQRETLSVFRADEWERVKDTYTFAAWTERAKAAK